MGMTRKLTSVCTFGMVKYTSRREAETKAASAQARLAKAEAKEAAARAKLLEAEVRDLERRADTASS